VWLWIPTDVGMTETLRIGRRYDGNRPDIGTIAIVIPATAGIHSIGLGWEWKMDADCRRHDGNYHDVKGFVNPWA
jgi:hypothetical protein